MKRPRVDVNLEELDQIIERGTQAPLSELESEKLKSALHALAGMLAKPRTTEKTKNVLEQPETPAPENDSEPPADKTPGHGRNGASSYTGAQESRRSASGHCTRATPVRAVKKAKSIRRKNLGLWCGSWDKRRWPQPCMNSTGCAAICAAKCSRPQEPEGVGPEKYDETTAAMIALLKYGSGMPFYRLEKLEHLLGIPLPASTQWEIVEEAAEADQSRA